MINLITFKFVFCWKKKVGRNRKPVALKKKKKDENGARSGFKNQYTQIGNIEQPRLERTSKDHEVQPFLEWGVQMRLSSSLSSCVLKTSSDKESPTSLGRLFQWSTLLTAKKLFLILRWNLSHYSLYLLFLVLSMWRRLWRCGCGDVLSSRKLPIPFCSHFVSTVELWWGPPQAFSSPGWKDPTPSVFPQ